MLEPAQASRSSLATSRSRPGFAACVVCHCTVAVLLHTTRGPTCLSEVVIWFVGGWYVDRTSTVTCTTGACVGWAKYRQNKVQELTAVRVYVPFRSDLVASSFSLREKPTGQQTFPPLNIEFLSSDCDLARGRRMTKFGKRA